MSVGGSVSDAELQVGRRPLPAWSLSLLSHIGLLLLVVYLSRFAPREAPSPEPVRRVGVALIRESADLTEYVTAAEAQRDASSGTSDSILEALPNTPVSTQLSQILPSADEGLLSAEALRLPPAGARGRAGRGRDGLSSQSSTTVFGTSGSGSTFVYVFDRSGSMSGFGGRPLAGAKRELTASLNDLNATTQFQVIFYNEDPHVFRFRSRAPRLEWATEECKSAASQFVQGIGATGSTRHLPALKLALGMRPDVIFFLTDADEPQLSDDELRQIRRWNQSTAINAIEFGYGPKSRRSRFLERLAEENGGHHAYVDVSGFSNR